MSLTEAADFRDESRELFALVAALPPAVCSGQFHPMLKWGVKLAGLLKR